MDQKHQAHVKRLQKGEFEVTTVVTEVLDRTALLHRHRNLKAELQGVRQERKRLSAREDSLLAQIEQTKTLLLEEGVDPDD